MTTTSNGEHMLYLTCTDMLQTYSSFPGPGKGRHSHWQKINHPPEQRLLCAKNLDCRRWALCEVCQGACNTACTSERGLLGTLAVITAEGYHHGPLGIKLCNILVHKMTSAVKDKHHACLQSAAAVSLTVTELISAMH